MADAGRLPPKAGRLPVKTERLVSSIERLLPAPHGTFPKAPEAAPEAQGMTLTEQPEAAAHNNATLANRPPLREA
jgi:hypothetical protein